MSKKLKVVCLPSVHLRWISNVCAHFSQFCLEAAWTQNPLKQTASTISGCRLCMLFIVACIQIHISFFHLKVQTINPLIVLKGNSTKCAHQIVFTGIYMWKKKRSIKTSVAPGEAAWNLVPTLPTMQVSNWVTCSGATKVLTQDLYILWCYPLFSVTKNTWLG